MAEKKAPGFGSIVSRKSWSQEKVVEELRELSMRLGHTPAARDAGTLTQAATFYFGSWNEAKRVAGLEACSRGRLKGTDPSVYLRAIAEGLRRLDEAIEEMTKLRKGKVQTYKMENPRYPSPRDRICHDLNWLKTRLGLLMIHLPELAERTGFALGTKPLQENVSEEGS